MSDFDTIAQLVNG